MCVSGGVPVPLLKKITADPNDGIYFIYSENPKVGCSHPFVPGSNTTKT